MDILIIDEGQNSINFTKKILEEKNFKVTRCQSFKKAINKGLINNHDLIILEIFYKDNDKISFVYKLRRKNINLPILIISSIPDTYTKIMFLKSGADDYLEKPFNNEELIAHIEAISRRYYNNFVDNEENYGNITFCWKENKIIREKKEIYLTRKEAEILKILVRNKGKTVKSEYLLNKIWQIGAGYHSNVLQSMIRHLRKSIDSDFSHKLIRNVHGIGYSLILPDEHPRNNRKGGQQHR